MQRWEYMHVVMDVGAKGRLVARSANWQELPDWKKGPLFSDYMNELGGQGWELVAVEATRYIFKRPRNET